MIFDTHTHYDDRAYDSDRNEILENLPKHGVGLICNMGSTMEGARESVRLSKQYKHVYAAAGVHPDETYDFFPGMKPDEIEELFKGLSFEQIDRHLGFDIEITAQSEKTVKNALDEGRLKNAETEFPAVLSEEKAAEHLKRIDECCRRVFAELTLLAKEKRTVAIGEIGLDYHGYGVFEIKPEKNIQRYFFLKQLKLAEALKLPVVIHSRNACADTMDIMRAAHKAGLKGAVIHCYSYSKDTAAECLGMGFYLGFGGVITYEGQKKLTKVLEITPADRILIETDCPYLTPAPVRIKEVNVRNDSTYLSYVINRAAEIRGMEPKELEAISYENGCRFYNV